VRNGGDSPQTDHGTFRVRATRNQRPLVERRGDLTVTVRYLVGVKTGRFAN
jgi:hypothetical protein